MTALDDVRLPVDELDPADCVDPAFVRSLSDEPEYVRGSLAALGRLLGAALAEPPGDLSTFVRRHLGVPLSEVGVVGTFLRGVDLPLVQVALAGILDRASSAVLADDTGRGAPGYELVAVGVDEHVSGPDDLAAYVRADEWCGIDVVALCTVLAAELPPGTTIVLVDASVSARGLGRIYESLPQLAPAAVFLDDIDLLAGDRRQGTGGPMLREFLTHLDGLAVPAPVLTVATTNAIGTIDPALVRPGRFDAVIEIGLPDAAGRREILRRLLAPLGDLDVEPVVARTDGASGADLREIVRRGVLERGTALTSGDLVELAATGRWRPTLPTGQYL